MLLLSLVALCAGCGGAKAPTFAGTPLSPPPDAPGFTLHDDAGRPVTFAARPDHYVIVTFLYTHCPDVCPIIAGNLNRVLKTPAARKVGLTVLAVSVDPTGDTAAAVRTYVKARGLVSTFHYLIGTRAQLAPVWRGFHIAAVPGAKGTVTHQAYEYLIDPAGHERVLYGADVEPGDITHDLAILTKET